MYKLIPILKTNKLKITAGTKKTKPTLIDVQIHWKVYFEKSIGKYFQGFFPENNIYLCQLAKNAEANGNNINQFINFVRPDPLQ